MASRSDGRSAEEMERTLYVANLDDRVTDEMLYELMVQAGPVENVTRPKDRPFGFVVFEHEESVPYSIAFFRGVHLFGRIIDIRPRDGTEQARKINLYMNEVREKRRQAAMDSADSSRRVASGAWAQTSMPPIPLFTPSPQDAPRFVSSINLAARGGGYYNDNSPADSGSNLRSLSWPRFPIGDNQYHAPPPPLPFVPPPPMPRPPQALFPSKHDSHSGIRDFSNKRRHDDRRYDRDESDTRNSYRSRGSDYDYQQRDNRYDQRDHNRKSGSRDRDDAYQNSSGRRSRGSNRK